MFNDAMRLGGALPPRPEERGLRAGIQVKKRPDDAHRHHGERHQNADQALLRE